MKTIKIEGGIKKVKGELRVPSDKSISHRSVIFGAVAKGRTSVREWLRAEDTLATLNIIRALGTQVVEEGNTLLIEGRGFLFEEPGDVLNAMNSGTTARIILGLLSTQPFFSILTGDESLRRRPMLRVVEPLRSMGASIDGREHGNKLPLSVRGGKLRGISLFNKKSSAQVKSSILLAGLRAEGITEVLEPVLSRDHTERMLRAFGVQITSVAQEKGHIVKLKGGQDLEGTEIYCPADPSSAAFFCALCILAPEGELLLKDVLVNPTRDGFFRKLRSMGARIEYTNERDISGEPVADILIEGRNKLKGTVVLPEEVPSMIDELPILAVVMALSEGRSEVRGAKELRVKESDRIKAIVQNLRNMGAKIEELDDGFVVEGVDRLKGTEIETFGDHRIAMAFTVAGLLAEGTSLIDNPECVRISYPSFFEDLNSIVEYL